MSTSHSTYPSGGGDASSKGNELHGSEVITTSNWGWLTQRIEKTADAGFDRWMDAKLTTLEADLHRFAVTHPVSTRRS
ncbi:hypothetical protein [Neorhodopirellula pilleata]|uniref:Uncharacterized protein n=1 Tax=Neorhodopirellula pilleata TaxID=2714738 RepID=A0A5C5ZZ60_9BACT|nr:hypothetical protein [Neorhodopirellula pilleata]TWT91603.1 hypothetical protein Pla100_49940 [Neorhodopirellula pilleata]